MHWKRKENRYILSIDGGGMRGIIPAHILGRINKLLRLLGDMRPLYSHFDLIAGTSTGALLALALAAPAPGLPQEDLPPYVVRKGFRKEGALMPGSDPGALEDLYVESGPRIFPSSFYSKPLLYPLFSDKYDELPLEAFLYSWFGETPLSSMSVPVLLTSYSPLEGQFSLFRSWEAGETQAREAARASSAAPMYFPPAEIGQKVYIDGGVAANNPSLLAYAEARRLYPEADGFHILSLSTCSLPLKFDPRVGLGGISGWASPIVKVYSDCSLQLVDALAPSIPGLDYIRVWAEPERHVKMDSTSEEDLGSLRQQAERAYRANEPAITSYAKALARERVHTDAVKIKGLEAIPGL